MPPRGELGRALAPRGQQLLPARLEAPVQLGDEVERLAAEDLLQPLVAGGGDVDGLMGGFP